MNARHQMLVNILAQAPADQGCTGPVLIGVTTGDRASANSPVLVGVGNVAALTITIRPARHGRYRAFLNGTPAGKREWRTPFLTAARKLLASGVNPATPLAMLHEGSSVVALRSTVGAAARLSVAEDARGTRFVRYTSDPARLNGLQQRDRRPRDGDASDGAEVRPPNGRSSSGVDASAAGAGSAANLAIPARRQMPPFNSARGAC